MLPYISSPFPPGKRSRSSCMSTLLQDSLFLSGQARKEVLPHKRKTVSEQGPALFRYGILISPSLFRAKSPAVLTFSLPCQKADPHEENAGQEKDRYRPPELSGLGNIGGRIKDIGKDNRRNALAAISVYGNTALDLAGFFSLSSFTKTVPFSSISTQSPDFAITRFTRILLL